MDTNNLIRIALQYKYHISKMGQKVWYIALCRITIASTLGCNILRNFNILYFKNIKE